MGTILQNYRPRLGQPTAGFRQWIDKINADVVNRLVPVLGERELVVPTVRVGQVPEMRSSYCIAQIPDFNTLITKSQEHRTPVFALTDQQIGRVGSVLEQDQRKREEFSNAFSALAKVVILLTDDEAGS